MGNIYNTPHEFDKSDPENIKIQEILKDKETRIIKFKKMRFLSDMICRMHIFDLMENLTEEFLGKRKEKKQEAEVNLIAILKNFCDKFEVLMDHNESRNYKFVQSLSDLWHNTIEYINECDLLMQPPKHVEPLKTVMKQIFQFPKKSDHSFGYYLNEYAGEKWLPFPFMDLLNTLHEDAVLNGTKSILYDWHRSLKLILDTLSDPE